MAKEERVAGLKMSKGNTALFKENFTDALKPASPHYTLVRLLDD